MSKFAFFVYFLCHLVLQGLLVQSNDVQKMDVFRLPAVVQPESYSIKFTPRFNGLNSTFSGEANIVIIPTASTEVITLNVKDLNLTNVTLQDVVSRKFVEIKYMVNITKNEQIEFHLTKGVIAHRRYQISIIYDGKIRTDMSGLYLSSYEESGVTKWLAVTQFEATSARKAFPCFDEPSYKAIFNISVVKNKNHTALSNMPIEKEKPDSNGMVVVNFHSTPPMSTYLVAVYVGEFVPNKKSSDFTVYSRKDYINQTDYVFFDGPKHIEALEEYTSIKYMLPKMDILAIPDFKAGAMENWGMTTYREYYILLHEESKTRLKIRSSEVVQHEFTHQWFGNLVTCAWWDYTWLNEGFARYFQYFTTKTVKTNWPMEELFVIEAHQGALAFDQTPRHPITASVNTPQEIEDNFDTITYSKAASVLRMLRYLLNENMFRISLQKYLADMKESVVTPDNLYSSIDNVLIDNGIEFGNGLNVQNFMSNWTTQAGYPILDIKKNKTANKYLLTQSRFFLNASDVKENEFSAWHVPLTFTTQHNKNFTYTEPIAWTNKQSNLTVIPAQNQSGWYIFNLQSTVFCRVNYDTDNWMALIKQLKDSHTDIHVLNRAQLIDDAFTLARAGKLDYSIPLNLTKYLTKENNTIPWYPAMNGLSFVLERMSRSDVGYKDLKAHVRQLAGSIYKKLETLVSSRNADFNVTSAWETFSVWACKLDHNDCTNNAVNYFKKWQAGNKISADIKDAAFCQGVKTSTGSATFDSIFDLYTKTMSISEKLSAETALGCSTNRTQLTQYINHLLDGPQGPIKEKDYNSVISSVSATPLGLDVLYEFLSNNINKTSEDIAEHIYSVLASKMINDSEIVKIKNLKNDSTISTSLRSAFEKSYEKVDHNLLWFNMHSSKVSQWASQNQQQIKDEDTMTSSTMKTPISTPRPISSSVYPSIYPQSSTSKPSSATSNVQNNFIILQLMVLTLLMKTYIL